jgi:hypothetical protein
MKLKRRVSTATWIEVESIEGKILTKNITGKIRAQFEKRTGVAPKGMRQEVVGINDDGTEKTQSYVAVEIDPVKVFDARLWLLEKCVEGVDAEWDDGTAMELGEEFFEAVAEDESIFEEWRKKAFDRGAQREQEVEKN